MIFFLDIPCLLTLIRTEKNQAPRNISNINGNKDAHSWVRQRSA